MIDEWRMPSVRKICDFSDRALRTGCVHDIMQMTQRGCLTGQPLYPFVRKCVRIDDTGKTKRRYSFIKIRELQGVCFMAESVKNKECLLGAEEIGGIIVETRIKSVKCVRDQGRETIG